MTVVNEEAWATVVDHHIWSLKSAYECTLAAIDYTDSLSIDTFS